MKDLPKLRNGQFYECWYAGQNNRRGNPELITAGTFAASNGTFNMWSAADPAKFKTMQITAEQAERQPARQDHTPAASPRPAPKGLVHPRERTSPNRSLDWREVRLEDVAGFSAVAVLPTRPF